MFTRAECIVIGVSNLLGFFSFFLGAQRVPSQPACRKNTFCMLRMPMFCPRDFHVWFRGYIARTKETLITLRLCLKVIRENVN